VEFAGEKVKLNGAVVSLNKGGNRKFESSRKNHTDLYPASSTETKMLPETIAPSSCCNTPSEELLNSMSCACDLITHPRERRRSVVTNVIVIFIVVVCFYFF